MVLWWRVAALSCALSILVSPRIVQAGGLYLTPLGAEPAARGGARVAGVSDPHALWYNPAGLAYSKRQLVIDLNLPIARASFTRFLPDGTSDVTASANSAVLPTPTIAYSDDFGLERFGFGIALVVPPAYALDWPSQVNGGPAPQRYSILDADGSAFGSLALSVAYRPLDRLSLGAALYITSAQLAGEVAISACDYAFCSQPEAPEWEGRTSFQLGPIVTASGIFGARYDFDRVRVGGSVQLRTKISGEADFDVALPDQALFDGVTLQNARGGDDLKAKMSVTLPTIVRLGVEGDLDPNTKLELAGTWENWAEQRSISVRPIGVVARDVPGVGDVRAEPVSLATNMRATWAVHLGGSHDLSRLLHGRKLLAHAGFMFESSSLTPRDLSATTIDTNKVLLALGASVEVVRGMLIDVSYGHVFMKNHVVRNSRVLLPAAIRPLPVDADPTMYEAGDRPAIGNGRYAVEADFVALGMRWMIEETRAYWRNRGEPRAATPDVVVTTPEPSAVHEPLAPPPPAPAPSIVTPPAQPAPEVVPAPAPSPAGDGASGLSPLPAQAPVITAPAPAQPPVPPPTTPAPVPSTPAVPQLAAPSELPPAGAPAAPPTTPPASN